MEAPRASVVVVSRHRPRWLVRCVTALGQLSYPACEIVVVTCPLGKAALSVPGSAPPMRVLTLDDPNIAKARNLGIAHAAGEIVAFLDDDAVPEPTWLHHLTAAFADISVSQAGGTTLGRNGISVQHAAARVDLLGVSHPVEAPGDHPSLIHAEQAAWPRLHGTNMAFRRKLLIDLGGFDERFGFYLDDTDMSLRVARSGGQTAYCPSAVVHHASAPGPNRWRDRTPRSASQIGYSAGAFHRSHTPEPDQDRARVLFLQDRRRWLLTHMQGGGLTPDDVCRLMAELIEGYARGKEVAPRRNEHLAPLDIPFRNCLPSVDRPDVFLCGWAHESLRLRAEAAVLVARGARVTLFLHSPTTLFHRVSFLPEGYWLHRGGIWGRELRDEPLVQPARRKTRLRRSFARLEGIRALNPINGADVAEMGKKTQYFPRYDIPRDPYLCNKPVNRAEEAEEVVQGAGECVEK